MSDKKKLDVNSWRRGIREDILNMKSEDLLLGKISRSLQQGQEEELLLRSETADFGFDQI